MPDLCSISRIFKTHNIMRVQRNVALSSSLMKQILSDEKNTQVSMMRSFSEQIHHICVGLPHHVINDDQTSTVAVAATIKIFHIRKTGFVLNSGVREWLNAAAAGPVVPKY